MAVITSTHTLHNLVVLAEESHDSFSAFQPSSIEGLSVCLQDCAKQFFPLTHWRREGGAA